MAIVLDRFNFMILLCQTIGITNINSIPTIASSHGTTGCIIILFATYIFLGIPLTYMELIIGQFTGRDCVDVWRIRPCLSYTGHILILWQVMILIYNHVFLSFTVHYFLISFENPIPYYKCGTWSNKDCNMLTNNYTVNEDCMKMRNPSQYCDAIYSTFPEYQYWRYNLLGMGSHKKIAIHVAWRVCLASGLVCIMVYLSCFKRKHSMKWFVSYLPIYAILCVVPVMLGSMLQKGLVSNFEDVLDLEFEVFMQKFRFASIIQQVVYNLGIGSGFSFNMASASSFRYNCFSNGIIAVVISAVFSTVVIFTTVMMACPYLFQHSITPEILLKPQMSLVFEKVPRLLSQYEYRLQWILLIFSCYVSVGLCTEVLISYNLLETVALRNQKVSNYPGLSSLVGVFFLFLITIPFLSNMGILYALAFRRYMCIVSTFVAIIECFVFMISYGTHRFFEDVHFMLGIQPSLYMKTTWLLAVLLLVYAFCSEIFYRYKTYAKGSIRIDTIGIYLLFTMCTFIVICCIGKMLVAICNKRFLNALTLDPSWGPRNQILQRSRGMFSAQAMTKEYMYRQYHLQAGIITRQKNSNKRIPNELEDQRYSL